MSFRDKMCYHSSMSIRRKIFWSKVKKSPHCWLWTAGHFCRQNGHPSYGCFSVRGRPAYAHRVAWLITNGPIPSGQQVLHTCDNPGCVRPTHLFLGTHADNMKDKQRKRRAPYGENAPSAKLKNVDVAIILAQKTRPYGWCPRKAKELGVSVHTIYNVIHGTKWRHLR